MVNGLQSKLSLSKLIGLLEVWINLNYLLVELYGRYKTNQTMVSLRSVHFQKLMVLFRIWVISKNYNIILCFII